MLGRLAALSLALVLIGCSDPTPADPPAADTTATPPPATTVGALSVSDVAETNPRLRTLSRLLEATRLDVTLADTSTAYTLFAPSDDAFAALGDDALAALEADPDAALAALQGHVVATRILSVDIFPDLSIETVGGTDVSFTEVGEGLAVQSGSATARITDADLDADNGVVHIIDTVLIP